MLRSQIIGLEKKYNRVMDASVRMSQKVLLPTMLLLLLLGGPRCLVLGTADEDIQCLRDVKGSVSDPLGFFESWTLLGPAFDYCTIHGVTCLHGVLNAIILANSSLSGSFPKVGMCKYLNNLDLSNNNFSGPISPTLCTDVPQLVTINLAYNHFDGLVPENLASCSFLNNLDVQENDLCGPVPDNINNETLPRLKEFIIYGNQLDRNCVSTPVKKSNTGVIVGAAIGALAVAILVTIGVIVYWCSFSRSIRKSSRWNEDDWIKQIRAPNFIIVSMFEKPLVKLKLSDLIAATDDFSKASMISTAKSGAVYKGILNDGSVMAIKRLAVTAHTNKQFRAEMETLGNLRHRNLVSLLGYCIAGKERILVYEYMPCGSLLDLLKGIAVKESAQNVPKGGTEADMESGVRPGSEMMERDPLDWQTRLNLAIGSARALAWLHHSCNPRVLHRDISPANILLDHELEPKITNFGLARLMNPVDTHVSTFVNGEYGDAGYVAPEYARTLAATVKGDVFSFGVVMLQLISGQKATEVSANKFKGNLAAWVWMLYNVGKVGDSIDKSLIDGIRDDELMQFLKLALSCVHPAPKERPSMYEVFHMLRAIGQKYHLTDENDDIPLAESGADLEAPDPVVSRKKVAG